MSATTLAHQGQELVERGLHAEAIAKLTQALAESRAPAWLLARSRAYVGTADFRRALADANEAVHVALARANRGLVAQAQYRRAVAYMRLGRYADADRACVWSSRLARGNPTNEKDATLDRVDADGFYKASVEEMLVDNEAYLAATASGSAAGGSRDEQLSKAMAGSTTETRQANMIFSMRSAALKKMAELPRGHDGRRALARQLPDPDEAKEEDVNTGAQADAAAKAAAPSSSSPAPAAAAGAATAPAKLRFQEFQSTTTMTVSLFSKGSDASRIAVRFSPSAVAIDNIKYADGVERPFYLALADDIIPAESRFTVSPSKVELSLRKKVVGKWAGLARKGTEPGPTPVEGADEATEQAAAGGAPSGEASLAAANTTAAPTTTTMTASAAPAAAVYPTSSRTGPKNWDRITDDAADDDESAQDINYFFKKLYKDATPEQQRAMTKSFVESNGTSLSTNWDDVKQKTVETVPPEGVDVKKWER